MKALYSKLLILGLLLCAGLRAETVITSNLRTLHGDIIAQTDDWIELRMEYGSVRIPRTNVVRIEQDTDAMAIECSTTSQESLDFAEKMKAEGKVLYHGRWVTPEEMAEQEAKIAEAKRLAAEQLAREQRRAQRAQEEA